MDAVSVIFGHGRSAMTALNQVGFEVGEGRTVGLVGESGSGKSTLAKAIVGIVALAGGSISIDGADIATLSRQQLGALRRKVQLIPQDPYSSLDPRRTIAEAVAEAIDPRRQDVRRHRDRIAAALEEVRLPADAMDRYPHEFSGGQRQRVAIARALIVEPAIIVADEITSALDVSVQAEVLELLGVLREQRELTMLFISHNLAVVSQVSDDIVVLYRGVCVERAPVERLFARPEHPYTRTLLESSPDSPGFRLD